MARVVIRVITFITFCAEKLFLHEPRPSGVMDYKFGVHRGQEVGCPVGNDIHHHHHQFIWIKPNTNAKAM